MPVIATSKVYEGERWRFSINELKVGEEYFASTQRSVVQLIPNDTIVTVKEKFPYYSSEDAVLVSYQDNDGKFKKIRLQLYDWDFTRKITGSTNSGGRKTKKSNKRKNKSKRKRATKHRRNKK
uniref:Uncharacterized protein n=1 Tax=viral metagenome TaxID=1070528 RepID=A0A6C0B4A6_9ZZZZ